VSQGDVEVVALEELLRRNSRGERGILAVSLAGLLAFVGLAYASALSGFLVGRQGELGVRIALGARRRDLVRLGLLQVLLLAVPGLLSGLPFAALALRRLADFVPFSLAALLPPRLDPGSLALALAGWVGVVAVGAVGVGLSSPQIGAGALLGADRAEGRRTRPRARVRLGFVCAALSLAVALGSVTAVLRQSLWNLERQPLGFEPAHAVSAVVRFRRPPELKEIPARLRQLTDRLAGISEVQAVGLSSALPFGGPGRYQDVSDPARSEFWQVRRQAVFGEYRQAVGLRLTAGRDLSSLEQETGAPVALLDTAGAREIFGRRSPLGQTLLVRDRPVEIVGVVSPSKGSALDEAAKPQLYIPLLFAMEAKAVPEALAVTARLSGTLREADFGVAIAGTGAVLSQFQPLAERVEAASSARRLAGDLAAVQWLAALGLVSLATFGTFSWLLEMRAHELALRLALGDSRAGIARRVLRSALGVIAIAVLVGLAIYFPSAQALRTLLFGVDVLSLSALLAAVGAVASVALFAAALAARSALRRLSIDLLRSHRGVS
jgi:hypothetical protein